MRDIPDTKEQARNILLQEAICWQSNAAKHYDQARAYREMYLDGLVGNYICCEDEMHMARIYADQARVILLALI